MDPIRNSDLEGKRTEEHGGVSPLARAAWLRDAIRYTFPYLMTEPPTAEG